MIDTQRPHNDKPIDQPSEDRFGVDPLARRLAASIGKIQAPEGTVIALNGPWGSGKSSVVNLILHHLKESSEGNGITVINFACWWFRGEDQLALAFFRELYAGLGASLGERFKKLLPKIGARLLRAGSVVGTAADVVGAHGAGSVAGAAMNWLSGLIQEDETVEKLYAELTKALADQDKRFLIVIDDIDRLAPEEALLIFRLVKSVGRLPNVIYLLAFDRLLAEAIVSEKYPTEGPHYLEKIIQAGFEIPEPRPEDLRRELLDQLGKISGTPEADDMVRFMNTFYDVVAPEITTPRDLARLANNLVVTWPAVGEEVDRADFIGLEVLRLMRPGLYRALRANKERLTKTIGSLSRWTDEQRNGFDKALLANVAETEQARLKRALIRLFPPLASVWANTVHGDHSKTEWSRQRRACTEDHFDTYFRFTIGDVLPKQEITQLIARASDQELVITTLRDALAIVLTGGSTKAALILDELNLHADSVAEDDIQPLLTAIFKISDELDVPADEAKAFSIGDNRLRIHWLLRRLTLERLNLPRRSAILKAACDTSALAWLVDFATSAYEDYHPREGKSPEPETRCLTTEADAIILHDKALACIREAAISGKLGSHPKLGYLLYRWRDVAKDGGAEVKTWTSAQLARDEMIVRFARALTSHGWRHGGDDSVAERTILANVSNLEEIMDEAVFRVRVEELAAQNPPDPAIREFSSAWRAQEAEQRRSG